MNKELIRRVQANQAEKTSNASLQGSQLDSFVVRSIALVMTFLNGDSTGKLYDFRVTSLNHVDLMAPVEGGSPIEFHARRKLLYPELHGLLGEHVASVRLDEGHQLIISFENGSSLIFSNEEELDFDPLNFNWCIDYDEEWALTPGVRSLSCVISETDEPEFYERKSA